MAFGGGFLGDKLDYGHAGFSQKLGGDTSAGEPNQIERFISSMCGKMEF